MRRLGIIGCGKVGGPVIQAVTSGRAGNSSVVAVLAQRQQEVFGVTTLSDQVEFFEHRYDLIIDAGTPDGLRQYGEAALRVADVWTVNATALADSDLYQLLEETGRRHGHRLRVLNGAIAGLDGLGAISADEQASVKVTVAIAPSEQGKEIVFRGNAREAAKEFPESVNVAVTAALAGPGIDNTQVEVVQPDISEERTLELSARSAFGKLDVKTIPAVQPQKGIHTVAANIISALRSEDEVIFVG